MGARYIFNKFRIIAVVIFSISVFSISANAGEIDISEKAFLKFGLGIITAFSIHEAAHMIVAETVDVDLDWEVGNYNQPLAFVEYGTSDSKGLALYSSGLVSQLIGSEIILYRDKIDKNDPFVRGMMAWNIINPILYAVDYWFIHRSNKQKVNNFQDDIEGIEHYSSESTADVFALSMVAIAAFRDIAS